jgi:DeoR/GlpR family transcriptional regulator of sugar metabolism
MENDSNRQLSAEERRSEIAKMVREQGKVFVSDLVKEYDLTDTSIRRDLILLENENQLKRIRGGAVPIPGNFRTDTFAEKEKLQVREKSSIGKIAAKMINRNEIVLLSSGTTTLQVVRHISPKLRVNNLVTLVTTSVPITNEILTWPSPDLTILGGIYLPDYQATVGPQTINLLSDITADIAFLGADGLTLKGGFTTANVLIAETDSKMVERARKTIFVVDSSKIGQAGFVPICPISPSTVLITDEYAPSDFVDSIRQMGVEVIIAE